MKQNLALGIMLAGHNILLTGQAGSGKTYVLNQFIKAARADGKSVAITATTGLAATHLGGNTIHAWSGIGIHDDLPSNFFADLPKGRSEAIQKADILIIDEISMLHDFRLDLIEEVTRKVRKNDKPFGGLQVILCGDFFQLPPVNRGGDPGKFVVHAKSWAQLAPVVCYLSEQHRQEDDDFLSILTAMRAGDLRQRHGNLLFARIGAQLRSGQEVTELHTNNIDVEAINQTALDALDSNEHHYFMQTTGSANYVDTLKRSCLAPDVLTLKKGALVMCIKNSQDKKYVNGSLGVVIDFEELTDYPIVQLRNGREIAITPDSWELRDGDKKRASLTQLPLRLAWAITVHKSQGMTLDAARINLRRAFVEGMGYVALSRVRSLNTLSLAGINRMALRVSPDAIAIDSDLQKQSRLAQKQFAGLEKTIKAPKKPKPKSDWAQKLATMRQTYPKAFTPWSKSDDATLIAQHKSGASIKTLSHKLGRQPSAIEARINKHFAN